MIFRYSDRRSFRRSGRCTHGTQANFPVFRPKKFPTIRSMYLRRSSHGYPCVTIYFGIQVDVPVSVFRPISFPFQTDCSFKTVSLPILTGILVLYPVGANFCGSFVFNPCLPWKSDSHCYHPFGFPADWIGAAVAPQICTYHCTYIFILGHSIS